MAESLENLRIPQLDELLRALKPEDQLVVYAPGTDKTYRYSAERLLLPEPVAAIPVGYTVHKYDPLTSTTSPQSFEEQLVIAEKDNVLYRLTNPNRPYASTDFAAELAAGDWVAIGSAGGVSTLAELNDVNLTSATAGQILMRGASGWVNADLNVDTIGALNKETADTIYQPIGDYAPVDHTHNIPWAQIQNKPSTFLGYGIVDSINALSDVDTLNTAPTIGQALVWNGKKWVPGTISGGDGSGSGVSIVNTEISWLKVPLIEIDEFYNVVVKNVTGQEPTAAWYEGDISFPIGIVETITPPADGVFRMDAIDVDSSGKYYVTLGEPGAVAGVAPALLDNRLRAGIVSWAGSSSTVSGATKLSELTDVDMSVLPSAGQVLKWNGTKWAPAADLVGDGTGGLTKTEADTYYQPLGDYAAGTHTHAEYLTKAQGDSYYEPIFTKNSAFNKAFGTAAGTVAEGNHAHTFASITSKPVTLAGYGIGDAYTKAEVDAKIPDVSGYLTKTQADGYYEAKFSKGTAFNKNFGTAAGTVASGDHTHTYALGDLSNVSAVAPSSGQVLKWNGTEWAPAADLVGDSTGGLTKAEADTYYQPLGSYEPAFTKNTGFNLNLGTTAGTVAAGDHTHSQYSPTSHTHALHQLSNVATTAPTSGQVLKYNGTAWAPAAEAGGSTVTDSATNGYIVINGVETLVWDNTGAFTKAEADTLYQVKGNYEPAFGKNSAFNKNFGTAAGTVAAGDHTHSQYASATHIHYLKDLGDVAVSAPALDQILKWNGTKWANGTLPAAATSINDLTDVDTVTTAPASGQVLKWNGSAWAPANDLLGDASSGSVVSDSATNGYIVIDGVETQVWDNSGAFTKAQADTYYELKFTKNTAFNKNFGTAAGTVAEGNHTHADYLTKAAADSYYEPVFAKNTGFNLALGTAAGTVAAGDHTHTGFASSTHTHALGDLSNVSNVAPTAGQVLKWSGTAWAPAADDGGSTSSGSTVTDSVTNGNIVVDGVEMVVWDNSGAFTQAAADTLYEPKFTKSTAFNKNFGTAAGTVAEGNHTHSGYASSTHTHALADLSTVTLTTPASGQVLKYNGTAWVNSADEGITKAEGDSWYQPVGNYEPAFTKNTAFNKAFGTAAGTVAEGNHTHTYALGDLSNVSAVAPASGQVLKWSGTEWAPATDNLGDASSGSVVSDSATNGYIIIDGVETQVWDNSGAFTKAQADTLYEPVFTKNTGFNKAFGTAAGTVAEGNHTHSNYSLNTHTHAIGDLSNVSAVAPASGQVLKWDGTQWAPATDNLGDSSSGSVVSDSATNGYIIIDGVETQVWDNSGAFTKAQADTLYEPVIGAKGTAFNKSFGTVAGSVAEGNHTHADYLTKATADTYYQPVGSYEPAFTKNTAFNKAFGTAAGTVAEGNHTHSGYASSAHTHAIGDLSNVTLTTPASGQIIKFNGTAWVNAADEGITKSAADTYYEPIISTKGTAFNKSFGTAAGTVAEGNHTHSGYASTSHTHALADLSTVTLTTPGAGQVLKYNGTAWVNASDDGITKAEADSWYQPVGSYEPAFTKNTGFNKAFGTAAGTVSEGNHTHSQYATTSHTHALGDLSNVTLTTPTSGQIVKFNGTAWVNATDEGITKSQADTYYEPVFTKNTAFNKAFGTAAGTVAEGNHSHSNYSLNTHTHALGDLSNVTLGTLASGQVLKWNGTAWVNGTDEGLLKSQADTYYEPVFTKNTAFNKAFGTAAGTVAEGNHLHTGVYEPVFTKNTGFNKAFGTAAGTVSEGNHTHTFSSLTSKPTTLAGYGIGNAYTKTEIDSLLSRTPQTIPGTGAVVMNVSSGYNANMAYTDATSLKINSAAGDDARVFVTGCNGNAITLDTGHTNLDADGVAITGLKLPATGSCYILMYQKSGTEKVWAVATAAKDTVAWANITNKPTTVAGYGITDTWTKTEADNRYELKGAGGGSADYLLKTEAGDVSLRGSGIEYLETIKDATDTTLRQVCVGSSDSSTGDMWSGNYSAINPFTNSVKSGIYTGTYKKNADGSQYSYHENDIVMQADGTAYDMRKSWVVTADAESVVEHKMASDNLKVTPGPEGGHYLKAYFMDKSDTIENEAFVHINGSKVKAENRFEARVTHKTSAGAWSDRRLVLNWAGLKFDHHTVRVDLPPAGVVVSGSNVTINTSERDMVDMTGVPTNNFTLIHDGANTGKRIMLYFPSCTNQLITLPTGFTHRLKGTAGAVTSIRLPNSSLPGTLEMWRVQDAVTLWELTTYS